MFDKFFDCLNVRHPDVHIKRRKPNLKPYTSATDERLNVLNCVTVLITIKNYFTINSVVAGEKFFRVSQGMGRQC